MGRWLVLMVCWWWVAAASLRAEEPMPGKQAAQTFQSTYAPSESMRYLLFLPQNYGSGDQRWPLLLFLHGAGECGDNLDLVKVHGPPKLVEQRPQDFPFVVVSPQASKVETPLVDRWEPKLLAELVDDVARRWAVDTDRLYVTGLSMGGYGTIRLAAHYPHKFAAAVPICGGGSTNYGRSLAPVPMWFFHGDADLVVPVERSIEVVRAMRQAGGNPRLTVYSGVGHDSWTETYNNPELYQWLLQHKLSQRPESPGRRR
jgi:predicted peptidase